MNLLFVACMLSTFFDSTASWNPYTKPVKAYRKSDVMKNADWLEERWFRTQDAPLDYCLTCFFEKNFQTVFAQIKGNVSFCYKFEDILIVKKGAVPLSDSELKINQDVGFYWFKSTRAATPTTTTTTPARQCNKPEVAEWDKNSMTYIYGKNSVTLKCADKFRLSNEPTKSIVSATCTAEGEWNPSNFHNLQCHPQCSSNIDHLNITAATKAQISVVKSKTMDNYDIQINGCTSGDESLYYDCLENGLWAGNIQDDSIQYLKSTHKLCKKD